MTDRSGQTVTIGSRVRIVKLDQSPQRQLPADEWDEVATMIGEVFEVYDIDEFGSAWVERVWLRPDAGQMSQSVALAPWNSRRTNAVGGRPRWRWACGCRRRSAAFGRGGGAGR